VLLTKDKKHSQYEGILKSLVKQYANKYNFEDMAQAAALGLEKALATYKNNMGASIATWIFIKVRKELQLIKNQENITSCSPKTREKLSKEIPVPICDVTLVIRETPYDILLEKDKNSEIMYIVSMLSRKLTKKETEIFTDYYLKSKSVTYIKSKYKIQNLDNLFTRFKKLLNEAKQKIL